MTNNSIHKNKDHDTSFYFDFSYPIMRMFVTIQRSMQTPESGPMIDSGWAISEIVSGQVGAWLIMIVNEKCSLKCDKPSDGPIWLLTSKLWIVLGKLLMTIKSQIVLNSLVGSGVVVEVDATRKCNIRIYNHI